jgi:hypothetical protein
MPLTSGRVVRGGSAWLVCVCLLNAGCSLLLDFASVTPGEEMPGHGTSPEDGDTGIDAGPPPTPDDTQPAPAAADPLPLPEVPAGTGVLVESASEGTPSNQLVSIGATAWPGLRFVAPRPGLTVKQVGFHGATAGGSLFFAFVSLTGPDDMPDAGNLMAADLRQLLTTQTAVVGGTDTLQFNTSVSLAPGWYALVIGCGSFDTTCGGGTLSRGHVPTAGSPPPLLLAPGQAPGPLPAADVRMFIRGTAAAPP